MFGYRKPCILESERRPINQWLSSRCFTSHWDYFTLLQTLPVKRFQKWTLLFQTYRQTFCLGMQIWNYYNKKWKSIAKPHASLSLKYIKMHVDIWINCSYILTTYTLVQCGNKEMGFIRDFVYKTWKEKESDYSRIGVRSNS